MKRLFVLLSILAAVSVRAQSTNAPATAAPVMAAPATIATVTNASSALASQALEAQLASRFQRTFTFREVKPNEVVTGNITLSGIGVEVAKKRNPLQLINPFAPAEYGAPEDNVVRDPINGRVTGLKLFAIRF